MDSLVSTGTLSAFGYSLYQLFEITKGTPHAIHKLYFESAAVIVTLVLMGSWLEARAKGRAKREMRSLLSLNPKNARRVGQPGGEET
jgi:Cu+-exporting ATPase